MHELTIVPVYQGMARYIAEARANPQSSLEALWGEHVLEAYWDQWAAGEFNEVRTRQELSQPILDLDGLEREVQQLEAGQVETVVAAAYEQIPTLLPYHEGRAAICVIAADPHNRWLVESSHGVMGACIGGNTLLTINPAGQNWQGWLPYILAHERHHSAWGYHFYFVKRRSGSNLLISLVSEGAADSFAARVCPGFQPEWVNALSAEEEAHQWKLMQESLRAPDPDGAIHRRFFFGSPEHGTPASTGYTIGFHIVQAYLKAHPQESVCEWLDHHPEKILAESGYGLGD